MAWVTDQQIAHSMGGIIPVRSYRWSDLNRQGFPRRILSAVRLPIPPHLLVRVSRRSKPINGLRALKYPTRFVSEAPSGCAPGQFGSSTAKLRFDIGVATVEVVEAAHL